MSEPVKPDAIDRSGDPGLKSLQDAFRGLFFVLKVLMVVLLVLYLFSGIFWLEMHERAIVLRFGRFVEYQENGVAKRVRGAGIWWAFPYPIDEVIRYPAQAERTVSTDDVYWFLETLRNQRLSAGGLDPLLEGHVLTGDKNILHCRWDVRYAVTDFAGFYANFRDADPQRGEDMVSDADDLVRGLLCNAVIRVVAGMNVDDAYKDNRAGMRDRVEDELKAALAQLPFGESFEVRGVTLDDVKPPRVTQAAFEAVNNAVSEKNHRTNQAKRDAVQIESRGVEEASEILAAAKADGERIKYSAEADSKYVSEIVAKYGDPGDRRIFLEYLHLETLEEALASAVEVYVLRGKRDGASREIWYRLPRDPEALRDYWKETQEQEKQSKATSAHTEH